MFVYLLYIMVGKNISVKRKMNKSQNQYFGSFDGTHLILFSKIRTVFKITLVTTQIDDFQCCGLRVCIMCQLNMSPICNLCMFFVSFVQYVGYVKTCLYILFYYLYFFRAIFNKVLNQERSLPSPHLLEIITNSSTGMSVKLSSCRQSSGFSRWFG